MLMIDCKLFCLWFEVIDQLATKTYVKTTMTFFSQQLHKQLYMSSIICHPGFQVQAARLSLTSHVIHAPASCSFYMLSQPL